MYICPQCGAQRPFKFSPFHYPADGGHELCGGEPVRAEEVPHREATTKLAKIGRRREAIRRRGTNGNGR